MISVVFSTREDNPKHIEHIKNTSGIHKGLEVKQYINNGEYSLTELYNKALKETTNKIVVFCHDDIIFDTKNWGKKLLKVMEKNSEYGIVGIAGSRELPSSAKWWENPKHMYGQVFHQKDGNRWLSKYSPKKPLFLDNVVVVDGLFFAVNKGIIKETFDESVEGFHFYDVDFSFRNYIAGVKVGVTSDIDVTHLSIGETNEQWEENRKSFADKHKDNLPAKAEKIFNKHNKMKVLIGCLNFKGLTGSEISTFELAKKLKEYGCEVHVYSNIGGVLSDKAKKIGIKLYDLNSPPGYKMGDGKWMLNINGNLTPSKRGNLYKIKEMDFDIIQINHQPIGKTLLNLYPNNPFINIIRSRMLPIEFPLIDSRIKKYISVDPSVVKFVSDNYVIPDEDNLLIYNITDIKKPTSNKYNVENFVLLPGTMNYLRKEMVYDMVEKTKKLGKNLVLVGTDNDFGYAKKLSEENKHVYYYGELSDISELYSKCEKVCGLYLGRTLIEGFKYNKKGCGYLVDNQGNIEEIMDDIYPEDINVLDNDNITKQYIELYKEVINMKDKIIESENSEQVIDQIRVAPGLSFFKNKLLKKYGLREYYDINKPCIFNGVYTMDDYLSVIKHKGHKTIVWCGSDAQALNKSLIDKAGNIRHIAKSKFVSNTLTKKGIKHILLPITPTTPVKNYKKKGENIYFYKGIDRNKYGGVLVDEIKKRTNYNIIEASHNTFKPDELEKVYESCFIGLRLTKHDGLPNTVLEMGLMGRKCLHNGNTPNSLNYESVDDIIKHIDNEFSKRNENSEKVVDDVYDFLNIDKEWLKI